MRRITIRLTQGGAGWAPALSAARLFEQVCTHSAQIARPTGSDRTSGAQRDPLVGAVMGLCRCLRAGLMRLGARPARARGLDQSHISQGHQEITASVSAVVAAEPARVLGPKYRGK